MPGLYENPEPTQAVACVRFHDYRCLDPRLTVFLRPAIKSLQRIRVTSHDDFGPAMVANVIPPIELHSDCRTASKNALNRVSEFAQSRPLEELSAFSSIAGNCDLLLFSFDTELRFFWFIVANYSIIISHYRRAFLDELEEIAVSHD